RHNRNLLVASVGFACRPTVRPCSGVVRRDVEQQAVVGEVGDQGMGVRPAVGWDAGDELRVGRVGDVENADALESAGVVRVRCILAAGGQGLGAVYREEHEIVPDGNIVLGTAASNG